MTSWTPRTAQKVRQEPVDLKSRVDAYAELQPWVHDHVLPGGIHTRHDIEDKPGSMVGKWRRLKPLLDEMDLQGKSVLDVGCNEGFFSIQAAQRGARVQGVDLDPLRIEKARFIANVLGQDVDFNVMDIYGEEYSKLPRFDVAFALGMLHRLPDPLRAIQQVVEHSDLAVFEWKSFRWGPSKGRYAYYVPGENKEGEILHPKFWRLSVPCVQAILEDLGYKHFRLIDGGRSSRVMLAGGRHDQPLLRPRPGDVRPPPRLEQFKSATKGYLADLRQMIRNKPL